MYECACGEIFEKQESHAAHRTHCDTDPKPNAECAWCGKEMKVAPRRIRDSGSGLVFCCTKHKNKAQSDESDVNISVSSDYGEEIIELRKSGLKYSEIVDELGCAKSSVAYHCQKEGLGSENAGGISNEKKQKIKDYYKDNTAEETAEALDVSRSTVIKYGDRKKKEPMSEEERLAKRAKERREKRQEQREKAIRLLGGKCKRCGYDKCNSALDFHHIEEKSFTLASAFGNNSWDVIKEELEKCILVCANCHREIHN